MPYFGDISQQAVTFDNENVPNAPWWHAYTQRCCVVQKLLKIVLMCLFLAKGPGYARLTTALLVPPFKFGVSDDIPAHDDGPNLYTHNLLNLRSIDK